jgi:hypothetical protein
LIQHVVYARPVYGEQNGIGVLRGLGRRASARPAIGLSCEPVELLLGAGIAENHLVPGPCKDRPELTAHQSRSENAHAHRGLRGRYGFTMILIASRSFMAR